MPKLREIIMPPPQPAGDPEQQLEELRDYLLRICEELSYLLTHLEADNIDDSTFERIQSMIPRPYTGLPVMDGDASSGQSEGWARGDHRHPKDTSKADVTALATETTAREAHEADTSNPHSVTAAQVGALPNTATLDDIQNGTTYAKTTAAQVAQIGTNQTNIGTIEGKIPSAASTSNQLADKAFVTDSITQGTAIFRGSFATKAALLAVAWQTADPDAPYYVSNNDYAVVLDDETQSEECWRYIYVTGTEWTPQYRINETPLTQAQLDALNSGATAVIISSVADKQEKITASGMLKGDGLGGVSAATAGTDYQDPLTAGVDYQTPLVAGTDYATPAQIPTVPDPSDAAPQDLGTAAAGSSGDYSRADHVHNMPDAEDIPYDNTGSGLSSTDVQAAIDEVAQGGGGGGPSPATATPVMDGTGAVGSSLLYAREDHEHPSDTAKQNAITASGMLKGDGAGGISAAVAGTDYQAPLTAGTDYATPTQLADKAAKADLTNIQATGTTNTTGAAIPAEALFYLNGILHRAKEQIGTNDLFTPGTNCEETTVGNEFGNLYTIDGTSVSAAANTDTNISITAPNGYRYGVFVGFSASNDYTKITLIAVAAQGTNYPNRIRFRSTVAQTVTARVLWFR